MATYLLLRSNKKSGPFQLEQLKEMGLKPYDLIWVEGRSAAWRYPGEVDELKEFAPIVEEQPFDRFFKKPEEKKEKHFHEIIEEAERLKAAKLKSSSKAGVQKAESVSHEKIYVSLPGESVSDHITHVIKKPAYEKATDKTDEYVQVKPGDQDSEKIESPLDRLKNKYAETYKTRTQKISRQNNRKKVIEFSLAATFLLVLGTLIYFNFKPSGLKPIVYSAPVINELPNRNSQQALTGENVDSKQNTDESVKFQTNLPVELKKNSPVEKSSNNKKVESVNENKTSDFEKKEIISGHSESDGQRQKSVREMRGSETEKTLKIASLVSVKANEYKRRNFGGIQNLELTVLNSSNFLLNKVIVELQYLKPSELPLKSEKIEFSSIAPHGSMTLKIPDNPRGIKVLYKITQIVSEQYDKDTAGL